MKSKKRTLLKSALVLLLCISMLVGNTFAWFTDRVSNSGNIITSGNLDLEMYWTDDLASGAWYNVEEDAYNTIFSYENWEPGYTEVKYIKLVNAGNLALNYDLAIEAQNGVGKLAEVINVYYAEGAIALADRTDLDQLSCVGLLNNVMGGVSAKGTLLPADQFNPNHPSGEVVLTVAMSMITTAGNEYQNETAGDFTVRALATQAPYESDSFGSDYDNGATPAAPIVGTTLTVPVTPVDGKVPAGGVTMAGNGVFATVPEGVKLNDGTNELKLTITPLDESSTGITTVNDEILIPVDVHIEGVAQDNTVPMIIDLGDVLPKYLNIGNYRLFHVEDGANQEMTLVADRSALVNHNQFTYDPITGAVSVAMANFSEVALLSASLPVWEGNRDYSWYDADAEELTIVNGDQLAGFGSIVGGMAKDENGNTIQDDFAGQTINLASDINLGDGEENNNANVIFYPIGYNSSDGKYEKTGEAITSSLKNFKGTFDGQGHTISNIYQNTWEMKGDHDWYTPQEQYYRDGMGLFGRVYGGTVKNLTVSNFKSDGEITTTGCIAAYADCGATFENIAITNCNPRVYNIGNGGIVGCVGWYTKETTDKKVTFNNITVDNSNKISALWGSYDVACGGIVGQYYPTSGQTVDGVKPVNAGIHFENCHITAQMDVYNDVCGNYQYYAYRYSGMIIGSIRENETIDGKVYPKMDGITAKGCTVHYETWNDYYYCEFEKNGHPSYSGPNDYKFSRMKHSDYSFTDYNGNGIIDTDAERATMKCNHEHSDVEDLRAVYLPFRQLFTGYGWGVTSKGIKDFEGIDTIDVEHTDQTDSMIKFTANYDEDPNVDGVQTSLLYRIGNGNEFPIGKLFAAKTDANINTSGVYVAVTAIEKNANITSTFKLNVNDWTQSTLKINGTGPAKITIQDYDRCIPTELYVEVVNANNITAETISSLGNGNVVLLSNTKLNDEGALALQNASLYGNGFEIDVSKGRNSSNKQLSDNYLLYLNNGTLDNVKIKGAVYTSYGAKAENDYNNPTILSLGKSKIFNSYISNSASPVRVRDGKLEIVNTTLKGGYLANLDIRGGNVILDNVTTINQASLNDKAANGKDIVGLGILFYFEGPGASTTLEIRNKLTQYNMIHKDYNGNEYAQMLLTEVFSNSTYLPVQYDGAWVNTGVLSLVASIKKDNIITTTQSNASTYTGFNIQYNLAGTVYDGYLYTAKPAAPVDTYTHPVNPNYEIIPQVSFDHKINEKIKENDGDASCTSDTATDTETITFADGGSFEWKTNILKSTNKAVDYTVWMDGKQCGDNIVFDASGNHTVVFKYTDANNYRLNAKGEVEKYSKEYETSMQLVVVEQPPTAKNAEITFPILSSYGTTKVVVDGKTYVMPNLTGTNVPKYGDDLDFDASKRNYGSLKADGKTSVDVYYPIIKIAMTSNKMPFVVFGNKSGTLVQIQDYADKGAGAALTPYNASTQNMPAGLSVVRGYTVAWSTKSDVVGSGSMSYGSWTDPEKGGTLAFKYQGSSDSVALGVVNNYLAYYPTTNLSSNDRNEQVVVAEYKYTDEKGDTFYYCIGFHIEERNKGYAFGETVPESSGGGGCVTGESMITLADGSKKMAKDIKSTDTLLVWDFFNGKYTAVPAALMINHGTGDWNVITLTFDDGTVVDAVTAHAFFNMDQNKTVLITPENARSYIGQSFAKATANGCKPVKLVDCKVTTKYTSSYSFVSAYHYNFIVEDMISLTNLVPDLFAGIQMGEGMKYDEAALKADIQKYGLYTHEDFAQYVSKEKFDIMNGQYMKISVAKGYITYEEIVDLIIGFMN